MMQPLLVPMSALEHWSYCPRQCGLIHLESVWDENLFTLVGTTAHERADEPTSRHERRLRIERALPVWSDQHGLIGKCDVVEFSPDGKICPVEYKSGGPAHRRHAEVQLCAQALCLEEMMGATINEGALFFAKTRERTPVPLDETLRRRTVDTIAAIRSMLAGTFLPPAVNDRRCPQCSLIDACLPTAVSPRPAHLIHLFRPQPETELP